MLFTSFTHQQVPAVALNPSQPTVHKLKVRNVFLKHNHLKLEAAAALCEIKKVMSQLYQHLENLLEGDNQFESGVTKHRIRRTTTTQDGVAFEHRSSTGIS